MAIAAVSLLMTPIPLAFLAFYINSAPKWFSHVDLTESAANISVRLALAIQFSVLPAVTLMLGVLAVISGRLFHAPAAYDPVNNPVSLIQNLK